MGVTTSKLTSFLTSLKPLLLGDDLLLLLLLGRLCNDLLLSLDLLGAVPVGRLVSTSSLDLDRLRSLLRLGRY